VVPMGVDPHGHHTGVSLGHAVPPPAPQASGSGMAGGGGRAHSRPEGGPGNDHRLELGHSANWHWAFGVGKPVDLAQPTVRLVGRAGSGGNFASLCNQALAEGDLSPICAIKH
jgi:hypothetical protein